MLSYTQGIRAEVERIKGPERLTRHEQWMTIHLRELPAVDAQIVAPSRKHLAGHGVNKADGTWMAEVLATGSQLVITWDQALLNETADLEGIEVIAPEEARSSLSISAGTPSRIAPTRDNPLSQQEWWKV